MGDSRLGSQNRNMFRFAAVACIAAFVAAEADPFYGSYGYGGYGLGYAGYGGYYGPHAAPAVAGGVAIRGYGQPVTVAHNAPYGYADADAYYGGYGIYLGPQTSGLSSISHAGFPLQGYAPGYGYGFGHYGKRSADADAYYGAYGLGYAGYGHGYAGYGGYYGPHAAPAVAGGVAIRGYGQPATVAHNAPYGYAASGIYAADSV